MKIRTKKMVNLFHYGVEVKSHLEVDERRVCAYCGAPIEADEVVIEKEIHGRAWRFCSEEHYRDFMDAIHFNDEDLDGYENDGNVLVGDREEE